MSQTDTIRLIIFDLDDTLIHEGFELEKMGQSIIFPETISVLKYLKSKGYLMAIASRNYRAKHYLEYLQLDHFFDFVHGEFTQESKVSHLRTVSHHFGVEHSKVFFFDDVQEYLDEAAQLGIRGHLVNWVTGITLENVRSCGLGIV